MAHIKAVVGEAGRKLGLRTAQRPDIAYGVKDGYLVQVASGTADGGACAVEIVRYVDASRDAAVRSAVAESPAVSNGIIKSRDIQIGDGLAIHRRRRRLFRSVDAQRVGSDVEALLASVKRACPPPPASCRLCGNTSASEPMTRNTEPPASGKGRGAVTAFVPWAKTPPATLRSAMRENFRAPVGHPRKQKEKTGDWSTE